MTGKYRQTLHDALEAELAPVRLSEARRAAILAAAGGAGARRRGGRPWRVCLTAAALCAALAVTAVAASPSLREALAHMLGGFEPYAQEVEGVAATDQGIQLRVVRVLADENGGTVYLEAEDLTGNRLSGDSVLDGNSCLAYDSQTHTALFTETFHAVEMERGLVDGQGTMNLAYSWLLPAAEDCQWGPHVPRVENTVLIPGQTPAELDTELFSLSSMGFDERGRFHIRIALEPGYALEGRVYATASSADGRNWQEGMEVTMLPDGEDILLPAITRENVSELQELELYGAYTGPESPIQGEWSLSLELDTVNTWTTADSWSAACGGITITRVQLSPLGVVAWYSGEGWLHEAEYLQVEQKDGKSPTWEAPTGGGDQAGGCVIWAFNEPVEPEDISSVTIRGVEIPLS